VLRPPSFWISSTVNCLKNRKKQKREIWHSWYRASWCISIVKPTRCKIFDFIEYHSPCFGRSFLPSTGVQDCTYSNKYMSYRFCGCLLAGMRWNQFHLVPASKQSTNLYDIYLIRYVQSWTPDDGRKDRPKHVEWYSIKSKILHLVGFTVEKKERKSWVLTSIFEARENVKRV